MTFKNFSYKSSKAQVTCLKINHLGLTSVSIHVSFHFHLAFLIIVCWGCFMLTSTLALCVVKSEQDNAIVFCKATG